MDRHLNTTRWHLGGNLQIGHGRGHRPDARGANPHSHGAHADAHANPEPDADPEANPESHPEANAHADPEANAYTNPESHPIANAHTEPDASRSGNLHHALTDPNARGGWNLRDANGIVNAVCSRHLGSERFRPGECLDRHGYAAHVSLARSDRVGDAAATVQRAD